MGCDWNGYLINFAYLFVSGLLRCLLVFKHFLFPGIDKLNKKDYTIALFYKGLEV